MVMEGKRLDIRNIMSQLGIEFAKWEEHCVSELLKEKHKEAESGLGESILEDTGAKVG